MLYYRIILLLRKNLVFQAVSMIRASRLSSDSRCGSHGWSRVRSRGWEDACGEAYRRIHNEPINIKELKRVLDELKAKTKDVLSVRPVYKAN
jgi:hypothetical protein